MTTSTQTSSQAAEVARIAEAIGGLLRAGFGQTDAVVSVGFKYGKPQITITGIRA